MRYFPAGSSASFSFGWAVAVGNQSAPKLQERIAVKKTTVQARGVFMIRLLRAGRVLGPLYRSRAPHARSIAIAEFVRIRPLTQLGKNAATRLEGCSRRWSRPRGRTVCRSSR